jgi:hypothetical protein
LQYACQFKLNLIFNTFEPIYLLAALILISSVDLLAESATPLQRRLTPVSIGISRPNFPSD